MSSYKPIEPTEVLDYLIGCPPNTKLYFGADSERLRVKGVWHFDITTVMVVHIGGNRGCKIFGEITRQRDYEKDKSRPIMRMMAEAFSVSELFNRLKDVVEASGFEYAIHIDINPDEVHGSSVAIQQAVGYIQGTCNVTPLSKPEAWAATYTADRYKEIRQFASNPGFANLSFKKRKKISAD